MRLPALPKEVADFGIRLLRRFVEIEGAQQATVLALSSAQVAAGDSQQAVAVCRDHPGEIDILVTDLGLPGVSGGELSREATELRPGMRVVYISGLPKEMAVADGLIEPAALLVKKPFSTELLIEALRSVLA